MGEMTIWLEMSKHGDEIFPTCWFWSYTNNLDLKKHRKKEIQFQILSMWLGKSAMIQPRPCHQKFTDAYFPSLKVISYAPNTETAWYRTRHCTYPRFSPLSCWSGRPSASAPRSTSARCRAPPWSGTPADQAPTHLWIDFSLPHPPYPQRLDLGCNAASDS